MDLSGKTTDRSSPPTSALRRGYTDSNAEIVFIQNYYIRFLSLYFLTLSAPMASISSIPATIDRILEWLNLNSAASSAVVVSACINKNCLIAAFRSLDFAVSRLFLSFSRSFSPVSSFILVRLNIVTLIQSPNSSNTACTSLVQHPPQGQSFHQLSTPAPARLTARLHQMRQHFMPPHCNITTPVWGNTNCFSYMVTTHRSCTK